MTTGFEAVWSAAAEVGVRNPAVTPANWALKAMLDEDSAAASEARRLASSAFGAGCGESRSSSASGSDAQMVLRCGVRGHVRNPRANWLKPDFSYKDLMTSSR